MEISKPVFASAILLSVMATATMYPFILNVHVTNFPTQQPDPPWKTLHVWENYPINWTAGEKKWMRTPEICVGGYNRLFIYMRVTNISSDQGGGTTVRITYIRWKPDATTDKPYYEPAGVANILFLGKADTDWAMGRNAILGSYCIFSFFIDPRYYSGEALCSIYVYLRNE